MLRVGNVGRFVAMDMIDKVIALGSAIGSNLDSMTQEERNKYRDFLQSELKKIDEKETKSKERIDVQ